MQSEAPIGDQVINLQTKSWEISKRLVILEKQGSRSHALRHAQEHIKQATDNCAKIIYEDYEATAAQKRNHDKMQHLLETTKRHLEHAEEYTIKAEQVTPKVQAKL